MYHPGWVDNREMTYRLPLTCAVLVAPVLLGQSTPEQPLQFEVASVKPLVLPPGRAMFMIGGNFNDSVLRMSGTRLATRGTLTNLLLAAFGLRSYQISGDVMLRGSNGRDQIYDVDARTPGDKSPPMDQVRAMLQNLLVERFQLKFHHETKELAAYDLVVGSSGVKFQASAPDGEMNFDQEFGPDQTIRYRYTSIAMWQFAQRLGGQFDRPLVDKTGLKGNYDLTLNYTPVRPGNLTPEAADLVNKTFGPEDDGKSAVSALRKQLGLNVVPAKEKIDILVIERVEKPAEN